MNIWALNREISARYDSVSPSKVTSLVAENIGEVLKEKGIQVDSVFVADVYKSVVKNYDCLLVGAPTIDRKSVV